jgi:hypothetical protein
VAVPLVLAGPIVRRVEPRRAAFWVALREQASVEVRTWEGAQFAAGGTGAVTGGASVFASGTASTVRLGDQLHVALVQVKPQAPAQPFGPGRVYSYDVIVTPSGGSATDLKAQGLLADGATPNAHADAPHHVALGYLTDRLPSFATAPTSIEDLQIAHLSCRNVAGPGVDAMAYLDDHIGDHLLDPTKRAHQLFLTGDQIYADSVPAPLLTMLNKLGRELIGRFEKLPIGSAQVEASLANFPALRRQKLINGLARMTSGSAANHLLSFAEYAAMYLCVWSNAPWQAIGTPNEIFTAMPSTTENHLTPWGEPHLLPPGENCYASVNEWKTKRAGDAKTKRVEEFRATVAKARRALANASTYMIFDDHEVTDDWNLASVWQDRVFTSPLGGTIIRNGVAAFTMFQGWGNDPAAYEKADSGNKKLIEAIPAMLAGSAIPVAAEAAKVDDVIGLDKSPSVDFHFTVDGPQHRVLALDTRTRRSFPGRLSPPKLLGGSLNKQIPTKPASWDKEVLIVISAVPVLGPPLIDRVGQPLAMHMVDFKAHVLKLDPDKLAPCKKPEELRGAEEYDAESWAFQEDHLEKMLERLAPYGSVVFLSGDVHYAMSATLDRWQKKDTGETSNRFIQLTSSPSRNVFKDAIAGFMRMSTFGVRAQRFGFPGERLAWKAKDPLDIPSGTKIAPGLRGRLKRTPVLVPAQHWKPGITIKSDRSPPDWRWRMNIVADVRPNSQRPDVPPHPPLGADIDTSDALPGYFRAVSRHGIAALQHFDHMRQIVFPNNFGLVSFPDDAGTRSVRHELWSAKRTDAGKGAPNTVHQVPLGVPASESPPDLQNES